jgi:hypothetical protein
LDLVAGLRGAGVFSPVSVARAAAPVGAVAGFAAAARGVVAFGSAAARRAAALAAGAPMWVTSIRVSSWRWPVRRR